MSLSLGSSVSVTFSLYRKAGSRLSAGLARLGQMYEVAQSRRALSQMDARTLSDIGVSTATLEEEANRKFWDVGPRDL